MFHESRIQDLSWAEISAVSGSGDTSGGCVYVEVGASLGLGLGVYGSTCGTFGVNWNAGVGGYATIGYANNSTTANSQIGQDGFTIGGNVNGSISGTTDYVGASATVGVIAKDSDAN